jgi:hypothetical protein
MLIIRLLQATIEVDVLLKPKSLSSFQLQLVASHKSLTHVHPTKAMAFPTQAAKMKFFETGCRICMFPN